MNTFPEDAIVKEVGAVKNGKSFESWCIKFLLKSWKDVVDFSRISYKGVTRRDFDGKENTIEVKNK